MEHTPAGDSRANGLAERAIQSVEKQVRIIRGSIEEQPGEFGVKHPVFLWCFIHSADVLDQFLVGDDALTAYERIEGCAYSGVTLEFGSLILYKLSARVEGGVVQPRWEKGV